MPHLPTIFVSNLSGRLAPQANLRLVEPKPDGSDRPTVAARVSTANVCVEPASTLGLPRHLRCGAILEGAARRISDIQISPFYLT